MPARVTSETGAAWISRTSTRTPPPSRSAASKHDVEALAHAAAVITTQAALITKLTLDQAALILDAKRR